MAQSLENIISAAHSVVRELLRTEVTAYDIETALDRCCERWSEQDRQTALRLAAEFAEIKGEALVLPTVTPHRETLAWTSHFSFVGYELGAYLDLPVLFEWTDEDRERSIFNRHIRYPLPPC